MLAEDAIKAAIRDYHSKVQAGQIKDQSGSIDVSQSVATGQTVATPNIGGK